MFSKMFYRTFSIGRALLNSVVHTYKKNMHVLYINLKDFYDTTFLYDKLYSHFELNNRYSIIVRVCYNSESVMVDWKALGEQIAFIFEKEDDLVPFYNTFIDTIHTRLEYVMLTYGIESKDIVAIQIFLYKVSFTEVVKEKDKYVFDAKSLNNAKELVNISETTSALNKTIPLTNVYKDFGTLLNKNIVNGIVVDIVLPDGTTLDILGRVNTYLDNNKKISFYSSDTDFYMRDIGYKIIITIEKVNAQKTNINIYNLSGLKIYNMVDTSLSLNTFSRRISNVVVYVNETGIYKKELLLDFKPVKPNIITGRLANMFYPDWAIGTMDLETYKDGPTLSKVYAAGFYVKGHLETFYIEDNLSSSDLILRCLDAMISDRYNGYTFYIHNLGKFDIAFLLKTIIDANSLNPNKYKHEFSPRDDLILAIKISSKVKTKTYSIKLVDSYNILNYKLSELCVTFDTEVKKSYFPYNFVNKNNLFYIGAKPSKTYYDISDDVSDNVEQFDYDKIPKKGWSLKAETLKYLEYDLISLYNVMDKFKNNIFTDYRTHVTRSLTISGVALDIYLRRYYDNNIPLINKKSIYNDIKESYYGGITEVYKPHGKNLYYYDVNSLYPYSALNPMPGLNCIYKFDINEYIENLDDKFFGFYYCKIETNDSYIGLLPTRTDKGITLPLGSFEGWYFSEELKFAHDQGYKIFVFKGYEFEKSYNVFNKYVNDFYNIKSTTKDTVTRTIAKSLLNNLLGRFGLDLDKSVMELTSVERFNELLQYKRIHSFKDIGDKVLVTHGAEVSPEVCHAHGVNYLEACVKDMKYHPNTRKSTSYNNVSVAISSAVTAYSRIHMNKVKLGILDRGSIYYMDTDSIVTDVTLDSNMVAPDIGKFKLEHEILEAFFISNKTYCLKKEDKKKKDDNLVIVSKGSEKKLISYKDFVKLYSGQSVDTQRYETIRDFSAGSATVKVPRKFTLSSDAYTKRSKIFDVNNRWIDTKPLVVGRRQYHTKIYKILDTYYYEILDLILFISMMSIIFILSMFISYILFDMYVTQDVDCVISMECLTKPYVEDIPVKSSILDLFTNKGKKVYIYNDIKAMEPVKIITNQECSNVTDIKSNILNVIKNEHYKGILNELDTCQHKVDSLQRELYLYKDTHKYVLDNIINMQKMLNNTNNN